MSRDPILTWFFSLVVVRRGARFLLVDEGSRGWYLPAGRVEPGETLAEAARREAVEESGVLVRLEGLIRLEHTPRWGEARVRAIFLAHPEEDPTPRQTPNEDTQGAAWFTLEEIERLPLRSTEVLRILRYVEGGGRVLPLDALVYEGAAYHLEPK